MAQTVEFNNGQYANQTTDISKIFVWENRFNNGLFDEPASGDTYTLLAGTLLGRIGATGKLKICSSVETDGSQFPIGIVAADVTMASLATDVNVYYCIYGDVAESKVLLSGAETFDSTVTVIAAGPLATDYLRTLRDLIQAAGIRLVGGTELTAYDNALT